MARPPKKRSEKKLSYLHIRITDELKVKIELAAAREGMDVSAFARNLMIRRARELGIDV